MKLPDEATMVANIIAVYDRSTPAQRQAGRRWYDEACNLAIIIANTTGTDVARVIHVVAALSPRNPWRWNVFDAFSFASARAEGRTVPSATTFGRNRLAAWRALDPSLTDPWRTVAPKVRAFVQAIMGDDEAVVVDAWAARIATGQVSAGKGFSLSEKQYAAIAHAYVVAANFVNEPPRDLQAITWIIAQTEGLASRRTGRHDLAFKAGTPDWMKELIS